MPTCQQEIIDIINNLGIGDVDNNGTDKISVHTYDRVYGPVLNRFRKKSGTLLELGSRFGGSAVLWCNLLPNFKLELADIAPENFNLAYRALLPDTNFRHCDAYTSETVQYYRELNPEGYDVIIDDGPHTLESQIYTVQNYLDLLKPGGVLIIEDIEAIENVQTLIGHVTPGHTYEYFDLREIKGRYDDIALVIRKKKVKRESKIVMIAMFKNEAPVLRRMLDSTLGHCDYYVMQNNGSTDGSEDIARQFLDENNLPGEIYFCEEGWQGFGWNRDHLIRYCQDKTAHGCDWILKMDCDEILEVDDDFDWSLIEDTSIPGFHITAVAGSTVYHRCWMWNARMQWGFNHDPCHETIYHQEMGEGFLRVNLPQGIRQIGLNEGQSWSNPTKFVTDALTLEEKMISENDMLELHRRYHFWYIGKSYFDAHECNTFPLGDSHRREYARRAIWYFAEWIKHVFKDRPPGVDESAYNGLIFSAEARRFLGEWEEALSTYKQAEVFAPIRNDHLIGQAQCLEYLKRYDEMLKVTERLIDPSRTNPFPHSASFINNEHYVNTGTLPGRLHQLALDYINAEKAKPVLPFYINTRQQQQRRMFVVDNFYANPDEIRNYALTQVEYEEDIRWYKGMRSKTTYRPKGLKESFEHIMGQKIVDFESGYNGVFQIMKSSDPQVYHYDSQRWAGMIYLTPNAPIISGTRLHKSKINGTRHRDEPECDVAFQGDFYDSTKFDITDSAANIYNRLLIMDAGSFHSAGPYFGNSMESGRLTHLFFFD
jgi:glycosyltransferase involved in cell wall biosynthesis